MDSDHRVRDRFGFVAFCRVRVKRVCPRDLVLLAAGFALFFLNDLVLKDLLSQTVFGWLFKNYFNDVLAGLAFMAYTNVLLALFRPKGRIACLRFAIPYIFACGLFWEFAAPLFVAGSVGDPWDLFAYVVGGIVYGVADVLVERCGRVTAADRSA